MTDTSGVQRVNLGDADDGEILILTGMSGAGRSTAADVLEDLGWYVVDNLPPQLLVSMADLVAQVRAQGVDVRLAAVVDVRARRFFADLQSALGKLRERGWRPHLFFLDATDEALVRRFESVRRPHPLQGDGRLLDGIQTERRLLQDMRAEAQVVVDTSGLNIHQLGRKVSQLVGSDRGPALRVAVMSFGFKYGVPLDADLVFDMRFLPNPFWVPDLKALTGRDRPVAEFVMSQPGAEDFLDRAVALMQPVTEGYLREGRSYATVGVGCTGGKHRSVAIAEELAARLGSDRVKTFLVHRDLGQE
jgi:UPF0042 nucleotide-binding protein